MIKTTINIKGMNCRSCEILIEEKLKQVSGVKNVSINYKTGEARIHSQIALSRNLIEDILKSSGYELGNNEPKALISQNPKEYLDLAISLIILILLYFVFIKTGILNVNFSSIDNPTNLFVVLLVGLTAGISTCIALVGGLILGISARHSEKHPDATSFQKFRPHLFFNLGRIISYFLFGGVVGLIGKAFQLSSPMLGVLTIGVGLTMLILGLQLTQIFPRISSLSITLPKSVSRLFGLKNQKGVEYSHANAMLIGVLTFFLPCGFTQAMQLFAMTSGNFLSGALIMSVFAIGTAPGLLGIGGLASLIKGRFARKFYKFTALIVISLSIYNISTGITLTGVKASFDDSGAISKSIETEIQKQTNQDNSSAIDDVQVIKTTFVSVAKDISPSSFTVLAGKPVRLEVDVRENGTGCMSTIMIPGLSNNAQYLQKGKILKLEFTPKKSGTYDITCAMGVKRGELIVK